MSSINSHVYQPHGTTVKNLLYLGQKKHIMQTLRTFADKNMYS